MISIDSNILAYAEGIGDEDRRGRALTFLNSLPTEMVVIPVQVLGELFAVLTKKARWPAKKARLAVLSWTDLFDTRATTHSALLAGMDLVTDHSFSSWDAIILAVTADAGCRIFASEDLQENFIWRGVTIVNPLASPDHPALARALN